MSQTPVRARSAFAAWKAAVNDDWYADDPHLQSMLGHYGRGDSADVLRSYARTCARTLDPLVRENNRDEHLPRLRRWDGTGNRVEGVDFHPSYHQIGRLAYGSGVMANYARTGQEFETLAQVYLFSQNGEAGHACPMACTAGLIKILQRSEGPHHAAWLERLLDANYDTHFHGAQFLTEVQGGSDVGANAVVARPSGDGSWRISGEKWFCSVIDANLFLVTARIDGERDGTRGLGAFAVPRLRPDGTTNGFAVRRLKFKLGTRSMASGETDFDDAYAIQVGTFRDTVEIVLNTSRLYNAICSCGSLQRAWREAHHYAQTRMAFGQPIARFPAVARIVARLRTEAYAARGLTFLLAHLADRMATSETPDAVTQAAWRMLVNFNKYWTSVQATLCVRDAIEILGGNGAIEEFTVLPRLLRDMIVCEAWEGGHNVLCAQAYKDSKKLGLHKAMFGVLADLGAPPARLAAVQARWEQLLDAPSETALLHVRDIADELRPLAQAAALTAESRTEGSDPLLPVVVDHLLTTSEPGYDALADTALADRISALVA